MGTEAIELVQNYDPDKAMFPAYVSEKLDGVPLRFVKITTFPFWQALTRQNKVAKGMQHIEVHLPQLITTLGGSITGEMYIRGKAFKDISGLVRDLKPHPELVLHVFDADIHNDPQAPYLARLEALRDRLEDWAAASGKAVSDLPIRLIPGMVVQSPRDAEEAFAAIMNANPTAEGVVLHHVLKEYKPGKRLWSTQRIKPVPTIDLRIVAFEEAVSSDNGQGLGMVGRIIAELNTLRDGKMHTQNIGVGPGALNHAQRKMLWLLSTTGKYKPAIAEIKYMRDDTYDALRQPTFVRWRDDKSSPDALA